MSDAIGPERRPAPGRDELRARIAAALRDDGTYPPMGQRGADAWAAAVLPVIDAWVAAGGRLK